MKRKEDIHKAKERPYPEVIQHFLERISGLFVHLNIRPNQITLFSLLFALIASVFLYLGSNRLFLLLAILFMCLSGLSDILDGEIARKIGRSTKLGDYYDCVSDELADSFIFIGIAFSNLCNTNLALLALVVKLLVSSFGLSARVIGASTIGRGVLARHNRFLFLFSIVLLEAVFQFGEIYSSLTLFDFLMLFFILGGIVTIYQRFVITIKTLKREAGES